MKKLILGTLLVASATVSNAQKIDNNDVSFTFLRRPMKPLPSNIKNYQSEIIMDYLADSESKMKEAQAQKEEKDKKYKEEMAEYKKKSLGERFLEKELLGSSKPTKENLLAPRIEKPVNVEILKAKYVKLEGYKPGSDNAAKITVHLQGFFMSAINTTSEQQNVYANGKTTSQTVWSSSYSYKFPMSLRVELPNGEVLLEEAPDRWNALRSYRTPNSTDPRASETYSTETYQNTVREQVLNDNMKYLKYMLDSLYGYPKIKHETEVTLITDKKGQYQDLKEAYDHAFNGYSTWDIDEAAAKVELQTALTAWETALKESNTSDKHARINEEVTIPTALNLVEAAIWLDNYKLAGMQIPKLKQLDLGRKERKRFERLTNLYKEQKLRFEANETASVGK